MSKESVSPKIILPVVLIAAMSGLVLSFVNDLTAERIQQVVRQALKDAILVVMPGFDNDPVAQKTERVQSEAVLTLYEARKGEELLGHAIKSTVGTGYSGELALIFGVTPDGTVTKVEILDSKETPGLGSKAADPDFLNQFKGKSLKNFNFKVKKDGGQIDSLTGATITSRAVGLAVERGLEGADGVLGSAR